MPVIESMLSGDGIPGLIYPGYAISYPLSLLANYFTFDLGFLKVQNDDTNN